MSKLITLSIAGAKVEPVVKNASTAIPQKKFYRAGLAPDLFGANCVELEKLISGGEFAAASQLFARNCYKPSKLGHQLVAAAKESNNADMTRMVGEMGEYVLLGLCDAASLEQRIPHLTDALRIANGLSPYFFYVVMGNIRAAIKALGINKVPEKLYKLMRGIEEEHKATFVEADWQNAGFVEVFKKPGMAVMKHKVSEYKVEVDTSSVKRRIEAAISEGNLVLASSFIEKAEFSLHDLACQLVSADPQMGEIGSLSSRFMARYFDHLMLVAFGGGERMPSEKAVLRFIDYFELKVSQDCGGYFHEKARVSSEIRSKGWIAPAPLVRRFSQIETQMKSSFSLDHWNALGFEVIDKRGDQIYLRHAEVGENITVFTPTSELIAIINDVTDEPAPNVPEALEPVSIEEAPAGKQKPVRKPRASNKKASTQEAEG